MRILRTSVMCGLAMLLLPSTKMVAQTTYYYTGNPFTFSVGYPGPCYSNANSITGNFTVATQLPPNFPFLVGNVTPLNFSFTDGLQTLTDQSAEYYQFSVSTDETGTITTWSVGVEDSAHDQFSINNYSALGYVFQGDEAYLFFNGGFCLGYNFNPGAWQGGGSGSCQVPQIQTPGPGAAPQSRYVALAGCGQAGNVVSILSDGVELASPTVDPDGNWETLIEPGSGSHQLIAHDSNGSSDPLTVNMFYVSPPTKITDTSPFLAMQMADIVVDTDPNSPQTRIYGPNYTHVALYVGGDTNGTPLIAEAVTAAESNGLGQVRTLPLDLSLIYEPSSTRVAVFRPKQQLNKPQRESVVNAAQGFTGPPQQNKGLPYWQNQDFLLIGKAWLEWPFHLLPGNDFNQLMAQIQSNTNSKSKFICSTLVWRSYLQGTGGTLDLSTPNLMSAAPGSILAPITDDNFLDLLRDDFIVPETFVRNTQKLQPAR